MQYKERESSPESERLPAKLSTFYYYPGKGNYQPADIQPFAATKAGIEPALHASLIAID